MKKLSFLFSLFVLLTAFTCEDEPLEGDFSTETTTTCEQAIINTADAALNFLAVNVDTYTQLCNAYKNALETQIDVCGDPDGSLQVALDALGDCTNNPVDDCDTATAAAVAAQLAFDDATAETYTALCNAYKTALENQIVECGDDGSIQSTIDGLGDCTQVMPEVEISLTAGTLPIEFDLVEVVVNGDILVVTGETSAANNYSIYFEIDQGATGVDIINSTFELSLTSVFFPSTQGFDDFTSTITVNSEGSLIGTFWGIVTNSDGGDLSLTSGMINITY